MAISKYSWKTEDLGGFLTLLYFESHIGEQAKLPKLNEGGVVPQRKYWETFHQEKGDWIVEGMNSSCPLTFGSPPAS